jgi:hypothetical protein
LAFLAGVLEVGVVDRDLDELPEAILFASSSAHSLALRLCSSMVGGGDAISAPTLFRLFLVATGDALVSLRFIGHSKHEFKAALQHVGWPQTKSNPC